MWIVKLALRRPYTFIVLAILIMLLGVFSIVRTPTDIFPNIQHPGRRGDLELHRACRPDEMATRLVLASERTAQTTVNDVEHTESQSLTGTSVVKYFFQPNVNEELSFAQITGGLADRPAPGAAGHHAAVHPHVQRLHGPDPAAGHVERQAHRGAAVRLRQPGSSARPIATIAGRLDALSLRRPAAPGADRSATRCAARPGPAPATTSTPPSATRTSIIPAGTQKIGDTEYNVRLNASPAPSMSSTICRCAAATAPSPTCATWPSCTTAIRRRPTSCASTAAARVLMIVLRRPAAASTLNIVNEHQGAPAAGARAQLPAGLQSSTDRRSVGVRARRHRAAW